MVNSGRLDQLFEQLDNSGKSIIQVIIDNFERAKGVLTVLITSLVHKLHDPKQDIRFHQENMKGGYSDRGIDTKYITLLESN